MDYNKRLDELFLRWMESLDEEQRKLFCKDGLMVQAGSRPEFVDALWEQASRRVMFMLKDKNTPDGDDIRLWLTDEKHGSNNRKLSGRDVGKSGFLPNIARILFALLKMRPDYRVTFDEVSNNKKDEVREIWNTQPFAFIESKKLAGFSSVSKRQMEIALERDEVFLKEEIDILRPNVIVCCDADDSQFNFVTQRYFAGKAAERIEYDYPNANMKPCCLWYYTTEKVAVIKSYHPSRLGKEEWMIFERVASPFHELIKRINI